jgi:UDP-N-acetyl-alpha-D-muramoyl-L-alanyl-L-glutamate epimerase
MIKDSAHNFCFDKYTFDEKALLVQLYYSCGKYKFCESVKFDHIGEPQNLSTVALQNALKLLHITAGISYYKAFARGVDTMTVGYELPSGVVEYFNHLYEEGLGEFYYTNDMPPVLAAKFVGGGSATAGDDADLSGYVVGLGGGKDSLTAVKLLSEIDESPISTFGVNASDILSYQADILGTNHFQVTRTFDIDASRSIAPEKPGTKIPNGHVPISAILGCIGLVGGILTGRANVVVAVERSADEPTRLDYQGKDINHQYSKSSDFEKAFNTVIKQWVGSNAGYFSILRPLRELDIMKLFYALDLDTELAGKYTSCNRSIGFTTGGDRSKLWCGECDKCAFIFLLMSGAGHFDDAVELFGSDLLANNDLRHTYESLLGLTESKPFDCVGEIDESRESMTIAKSFSAGARAYIYPAEKSSEIWNENNNLPNDISTRLKDKVLALLAVNK